MPPLYTFSKIHLTPSLIRPLLLLMGLLLIGVSLPSAYGQQVLPDELHLDKPHTPARAKNKITIYNGFTVPAGGSFEGELNPEAVSSKAPSTLTVSANVTIYSGETTPLTASAAPVSGNALLFDGVNDYVNMPAGYATISGSFTWEAWVNPTMSHGIDSQTTSGITGTTGQRYVVFPAHGDGWGTSHVGMGISVGTNGISVYEHGGGYLPALLVWQGTLSGWNHIAVIYRNNKSELFVNGQLVAQGLQSSKIVHPSSLLGGGVYGYYAGQLDEVRVWNTARSAAEIQASYQQTVSPATAGLAGYWQMDEALSSHLVNDLTASASHGTLFNAVRRVSSTVPFQGLAARSFAWSGADAGSLASYLSATNLPGVTFTAPSVSTPTVYTYQVTSPPNDPVTVTVTVKPALANMPEPDENRNYIIENTVLVPGQTETSIASLSAVQLTRTTTYFDGLGRPEQQVTQQGSPGLKDIVQPIEYDPFGRETKKYLPYAYPGAGDGKFKTDALGPASPNRQQAFYDQAKRTADGASEGNAFAPIRYEASPLNRVLEQGAPGRDWQITDPDPEKNHTIKTTTRTNTPGEVREWHYDFSSGAITGSSFYGFSNDEGQLLVTEVIDEQQRKTSEYKDKEGRVVCKKVQDGDNSHATTYYVYDDFGYLRYVLPPQAVDLLEDAAKGSNYTYSTAERAHVPTAFTITPQQNGTFIGNWLFAYSYDERGRMIEKQVPGSGLVFMVYNERDELILTQDERQRQGYNAIKQDGNGENHVAGEWSFTKYDAFGRVVMSGLYSAGITTREGMLTRLGTQTALFEERTTTTGNVEGYSSRAFPQGGFTALTVNYYDDYSFRPASHQYVAYPGFEPTPFSQVRGKATGSKVKVLGTGQWLLSVSYYDKYSRVIQTIADNHSKNGSTNGKDIVSNHYDFAGRLLNSELHHENWQAVGAKSRTIKTRSVYDHAGRVTGTYQQIDQGTEERLSLLEYNELGELTKKTLSREGVQQADYAYNLRGWLKGINNPTSKQTLGEDLFGMQLSYNEPEAATRQYNGNISRQSWMSHSDKVLRQYDYSYDHLNRLKTATYQATAGTSNVTLGKFSVTGLSYDKNGNILSLTREGQQAQGSFGVVDQLTYNYIHPSSGYGNQLTKVTDGVSNQAYLAGDFKDKVNQDQEYKYDRSGNLQQDLNKGISSVLYNHLNLPVLVSFGSDRFIRYVYDAAGSKKQKIVKDGTSTQLTDYLSGMVYESNQLQFIPTGEGRALPPEQTGEYFFAYEYHYKDHLGNLRLSFRKQPDVPAYSASMEVAMAVIEEAQFDNVRVTRNGERKLNGSQAAKLSSDGTKTSTGQPQVLGPWRTVRVLPGDKVTASAYAYYENSTQNTNRISLTLFLGPQGSASPTSGESSNNLWDKLRIGVSAPLAKPVTSSDNTVPVAYLKYIFYDKNYQFVQDEVVQVTTQALSQWQPLSLPEFIAQQEGYLQILVANESDKPVWFDDLLIKHTPALIVQENHYDPWGLNLVGIEKSGNPDHKFQYNGKEKQEELGLNWLDYGARMYDPQLGGGGWRSVDPMADKMPMVSPYVYALNNPIKYVDKDGAIPIIPLLLKAGAAGAADLLAQVAMNYYFDDKATTLQAAFDNVNWWQVSRSSAEGLIPWKTPGGRIGRAAGTAAGDVLVNIADKGPDYSGEQAMQDFATGFIGDLAGGGLGELISKYGMNSVTRGLARMGFGAKAIDKLTGVLNWKFSSKDPLVGDLANSIDGALGKGTVQDVEKPFSSLAGNGNVDISTNNYNVEVKTGGKSKMGQSQKNKNQAALEGKKYVLFYPDATDAQIREAQKQGINIITSEDVLIKTLNGK